MKMITVLLNKFQNHQRALGLVLYLLSPTAFGQNVVNSGTTLSVGSAATLYVPGSLTNATGATLQTNGGTLRVDGDLTNAGTATLSSGTVDVRGNVTSTGTLTGGTSTLQLKGTAAQTLQVASGTTLHNLTIDNSSGTTPAVSVPNSLNVDGTLTLTNGLVRTAQTATISLPDGATLSGETTGRYVQGNVQVTRSSVTGATDFGLGVVLDGTGQSLGSVTVKRTAGLQTAGVSYGQNVGGTTQGIDRVWTITPTQQPSAAVPLTLTWLADDDNTLTDFTQAQLWQSASAAGPWVAVGSTTNASSRSFTGSVSSLGTFTISNLANPLPVELTSFTAERRNADALLRWTTAQERNNDYFAVEVSTDGHTFRQVGQVAGRGTSMQATTYAYTDHGIDRYATNLLYYRLRQVDLNGTATYSVVRTVRVENAAGLLAQAWPNPFNTAGVQLQLRTDAAGPVSLRLYDAVGRAVLTRTVNLVAGSGTLSWAETATLPQGVYSLLVQQGPRRVTLKLVRE